MAIFTMSRFTLKSKYGHIYERNLNIGDRANKKTTSGLSTNQNLNVRINSTRKGGEIFFHLLSGQHHRGEIKQSKGGV